MVGHVPARSRRARALRARRPRPHPSDSAPPPITVVHRSDSDRALWRAVQADAAPVPHTPRAADGEKAHACSRQSVSFARAVHPARCAPWAHPCRWTRAVAGAAVLPPDLRPPRPCAHGSALRSSCLRRGALRRRRRQSKHQNFTARSRGRGSGLHNDRRPLCRCSCVRHPGRASDSSSSRLGALGRRI
eukprot:Amastigsp_a510108_42.p2 type:complete len:189 gc:universal Amastigsp_a510108_42:1174-608(-)